MELNMTQTKSMEGQKERIKRYQRLILEKAKPEEIIFMDSETFTEEKIVKKG